MVQEGDLNPAPTVGIESIFVHVPRHYLALDELALANGVDPAKYEIGLGCRRMSVAAPGEDPVTMAAEAAWGLLDAYAKDPAGIGLLVVGTESGVDGAKPIASYLHGLLGLSEECRTFDAKHACYSATAALRLAADWCLRQGNRKRRKALVVATDVARYLVGSPGEPTQGAGAVALLVSDEPRVLGIETAPEAVVTREIMDFWRPHYRQEALVDGRVSIESYLAALERTWDLYRRGSGLGWDDYAYLLFHVPFPRMAYKAYRLLHDGESSRRGGAGIGPVDEEFGRRTQPGLWPNQEIGNIYSGSLYLSLAGLLESQGHRAEGARVGMFSYGSGSCAEFFSGLAGPHASEWKEKTGLLKGLHDRVALDHRHYLDFRQQCEARTVSGSCCLDADPSADSCRIRFCGIRDHRRVYLPVAGRLRAAPHFELDPVVHVEAPSPKARSNSASAQIGK